MNLWSSLVEALESLSANKSRSGLTMLGIMIGVAAVVAMLGLGNGTQAAINQQIQSIGVNLLYVAPGGDATNPEPLTTQDAQTIADPRFAPSVAYVAPVLQGQVVVSTVGESTSTSLVGITPEFFEVQTAELSEGAPISQEQQDEYATVVLLGSDVAEELFGRTSQLVGEKVRIGSQIFKVVGVLAKQGGTNFGSSDNRILVPLTTAQVRLLRRSTSDQVDMLYVQAKSAEQVSSAVEEVSQILRARHRSNLGVDDFDIMNTQSLLDTAASITGMMTMFLGGIAGISLLVGGIGIMNIMLVTVVERTREIGLRKAVGARKIDILAQFLVEASLLSLSGGLIGIALGYALAALVGQIASFGGNPIQPLVELNAILLASLFSAAVGLFFGLYPANRAANLEPVEALRTE